jgi:chromosomal replication initiation ATPase DnaA
MIKVAMASKHERQVRSAMDYLAEKYEIADRQDQRKEEDFLSIATMKNSQDDEIFEILQTIVNVTGYDPRSANKRRQAMNGKRAASYILRHRYGMSLARVGEVLNCCHASILFRLLKMENVEVGKTVPIELAVRRALKAAER